MPISALYILDINGSILISRDYRADADKTLLDNFATLVDQNEDDGSSSPVIYLKGVSVAYIKVNDLFIAAVMTKNCNITLVFTLMHSFVKILISYLNKLESESIKDNFVVIHELLDEIIDYGYPQVTDSNILQMYILQQGYKLKKSRSLPAVLTNAVSWRPAGIRYRKNEVFIDVVESVNLMITSNKHILQHEVSGSVKMKVHLSGMPQIRLGLSDKIVEMALDRDSVIFEGLKFHHCVQLSKIGDKNLYFVPPDGDFELMSYRVNADLRPLIAIEATETKHMHSRVEYVVKAVSQFKASSTANNVEIVVPVAEFVDTPNIKVSAGAATYQPEIDSVVWKIKFLPGGVEHFLKAYFKLSSVEAEDKTAKRPIQVKFSIPYFTVSGLQVRYIKVVENNTYKAFTWVRYATQNGEYLINFKLT